MIIGFTGTRNGMSLRQKATVIHELLMRQPMGIERVVHGDCLGADADFDAVCKGLGIRCGIRPCTYHSMRAHCDSELLAEPEKPMVRNRAIVADADVLIACPPNAERIKRGSGTWATIGFGERAGIEVVVVFPDGTVRA